MSPIASRRAMSLEILQSGTLLAVVTAGLGAADGGFLDLGQDYPLCAVSLFLAVDAASMPG